MQQVELSLFQSMENEVLLNDFVFRVRRRDKKLFHKKLQAMPDGNYDVIYNTKRYLLSKHTQLQGKLIKFYAEELGDNDFISLNYYPQIKDGLLKPCEMSEDKVMEFVIELNRVGE